MGMLQLLKTTKLDAEQHYFVETAMVSANSLLRILGDILDLSKIESGRMDLLEEPFEVVSVVEPVINAFRETAAAKGVELLVSLDPELPRFLRGDPVRIRQILYNLTGNAIKFTDGGEVSLNIRPLPVGGGDRRRVHITVSDSGPGFEDEQVERLFDTFTQGNSALSRSHGGAGLGLSIVKRLVDLMGGSLAVDSPEGSGAEVHVSLELGVAEAAPSESARHRETAKPSPGEKPCILLAEDDKISRMAMERSLELAGFDAVSVTDGQQALDALQAQQFDAVLMDVRMPVLDGLQAARALREREQEQGLPRTPVIAVTAHAMAGDREQILAAGMDDYVTKPVDMDSLAAALRRILGL
jgi:CheY-like chemotaxis protein